MKTKLAVLLLIFVSALMLRLTAQPEFLDVNYSDGAVPLFGLFEVEVLISTAAENPFDYDHAWLKGTITDPKGVETVIDGFYYQHFVRTEALELSASGLPFFKLRYAPRQTGQHSIVLEFIDAEGVISTTAHNFLVTESNHKGFVHQSEQGRYLEHEMGETAFLIGQNIAWADFESGTDRMHEYMQRLHDHGGNFAKLMLVPWSYKFEWVEGGLRNYMPRQDRAFMIDSIFSMAKGYGMYMQLAFAIHNELRFGYPAEDWTSNPYNQDNGGPCANPLEFFTHPQAKAAFKNKIRYIVARWAYEPYLVAWEVMSEADNFPFYKPNSATIAAWINEMAVFLKSIDPYNHLVSAGFALLESNPQVWNHAAIDFTQTHYYKKESDLEGYLVRQNQLYLRQYGKPMLTGEFDLGHFHDSLIAWDPDGLALHNTFWASAMSGSFGAAVPWFWDNYIDALNLYFRYQGISQFMSNEQLTQADYQPLHLPVFTNQRKNLVVEPTYFDLIAKSPTKLFMLEPTGLMIPGDDSLGMMLYGPNSVFQVLRNPPVFQGYWPSAALLSIETGSQVFNSRLQVKLNDNIIFEQNVQPGTIYTIEIPPGNHQLRLDNIGTAFSSAMELRQLVFHDYLHQLRAFALHATDKSLVWIHNRDHNWEFINSKGFVPEAVGGQLMLPYYSGQYEAKWYNTVTGMLNSTSMHTASTQGLAIPIEPISTDLGLKLNMVSQVASVYGSTRRVLVYPNPSDKVFYFVLEQEGSSNMLLEIFDLTGRIVYHRHINFHDTATKEFEWKGADDANIPVSRGMYFYRIRTPSDTFTGKIVKN